MPNITKINVDNNMAMQTTAKNTQVSETITPTSRMDAPPVSFDNLQ